MNRFPHAQIVLGLLTSSEAPAYAEPLLLDREGLIQLLQNALYELHDLRRDLGNAPAEADVLQRVRYLDAVLEWVKEQRGSDLAVMSRSTK